jgi:NAD(P)-dependent dehydrogenase (short-subunit alcohol dehydrogenase family)
VDFSSRHVVVTGGTGALGSGVVAALLEAGAICHVPARGDTSGSPHAGNPNVRFARVADLTDEDAVLAFYGAIPQLWASIHIAGGYAMSRVAETSKAALLEQVNTNFTTAFLCCRAALMAFARAGTGGRIVNVAARPGLEPRTGSGMAAYTASKAAVAALTVALAQEVTKQDILVNAVAPSTIDTAANRKDMPKADHAAWPKVEEIAATILFLASPENTVTRGAVVPVYGKS